MSEVSIPVDAPIQTSSKSVWDYIDPLNISGKFAELKKPFQLTSPGTYEDLHKEVRMISTAQHLIDGANFEFTKMINPNIQINNTFTLGSVQTPSVYNFIGVYADENVFFQGTSDSEFNVNGRLHYSPSKTTTGKMVLQTGLNQPQSMVQLEADYLGDDSNLNIKAINPSPSDKTGIFVASYLQSVSKHLSLGAEAVFNRSSPNMADVMMSVAAKYATPQSILSAQLHDNGIAQASYFHKVSEIAEVGVDLQTVIAPSKRDAICSIGAKFEFKQATMRTQIDTTGRLSTVIEERIAPPLSLFLSGDLDHFKGSSKFGLGVRFSL